MITTNIFNGTTFYGDRIVEYVLKTIIEDSRGTAELVLLQYNSSYRLELPADIVSAIYDMNAKIMIWYYNKESPTDLEIDLLLGSELVQETVRRILEQIKEKYKLDLNLENIEVGRIIIMQNEIKVEVTGTAFKRVSIQRNYRILLGGEGK